MRAIRVHQTGGPEVLQLEEIALPEPGPGEVRVMIRAVGVNYIDIYNRKGQYKGQLPFTPGSEAGGEVHAVGEGVEGLAVGDPVAEFMDPVRITPDMSTEAVVRTVLEADQKLVDQFRRLAESGPSEDVRELFQKLIAIEEREEHLLVRDAAELEDV